MPKKKKVVTYTIDELSPAAQQTAIGNFWEDAFDASDADDLTKEFELILMEKGVRSTLVNWSLGHCQGDGVCFSGYVNVSKVILENKLERFALLEEHAQRDGVEARIYRDSHRYCHSNSMRVEVTLYGDETDFFPKALREESLLWEEKRERLWEDHRREWARVEERNRAPEREWERLFIEWQKHGPKSPQDWSPIYRHPGPKPALLTEPHPAEPKLPRPPRLQEAVDQTKATWKKLEVLANELEEWLSEWVENVSRELEKIGYAEIESRRSDESIIDFFRGNEWEFLEDGKRWKI